MSYLTEFDQERHDRALLRQGIEQGVKQGIEQGIERGIEQGIERGIEQGREAFLERAAGAVRDGVLTLPEAASVFGFAEDEIRVRL